FEMEFPPKGQMGAQMAAAAQNFKKTGTSREIAGYKCQDYTGGGHVMAGEYSIKECFSKDAPGAAEFAAFQKAVASKLKSVGGAPASSNEIPDGVPLASDSTTKMGRISLPGLPPERAAKINEMMAKRPPVTTKTVVTKIESQHLSDDSFVVPAGYTK